MKLTERNRDYKITNNRTTGVRQVRTMKYRLSFIKKITTMFTIVLFSIMLPATLFGSLFASNASALLSIGGDADCSANSVINCGVPSTDYLSTYLPGHTAILDLYASQPFGINQDDLNNIGQTTEYPNEDYTVEGTVNVNNDVIVGGKIVATDAITAGRTNMKNIYGSSTPRTFDGVTFYERAPRVSFTQASLEAYVVMKNGVFQFAILAPCGNPVSATPVPTTVTPIYKCDSLTAQVSSSDPSVVVMSVTHTQSGGAVFKNVTYIIDNITTGSTTTVANASDSNVSYTFPNYGTQNISATVNFTLNGSTVSNSGEGNDCTRSVAYAMPPPTTPPPSGSYSCSSFNISSETNTNNDGIIVTSMENASGDATFTQAVYDFGDDATLDQKITSPGTSTVDHTYTSPGTYVVSVTDSFSVNGSNVSIVGNCEGQVTIPPPPTQPSCTIAGLTQYASNSPNCVVVIPPGNTPTTTSGALVNTGPGGVLTFIGILVIAAAVSGGGYYLLLKHQNKDPLDEL